MKKTSEKSYDLFLVHSRTGEGRKFRLSRKNLCLLTGGCLLAFSFLIFNFAGFCYYRAHSASLEKRLQVVTAYETEKAELATRMALLEKTVSETEKMTGKLASLVGNVKVPLQRGVGPVPLSRFDLQRKTEGVNLAALQPKMDQLEDVALNLQGRIKELIKLQEDKLSYLASTPSLWPVKGWVTSDFGYRRSPFTFARDFHPGIDVAAQWGTPIVAAADGVVTFANYRGGLGKVVMLDHGFGVKTVYGHTSTLLVKEGQKVTKGMKLALVGSTGHSTGPHLHYEIRVDGVPVDPMKYIFPQPMSAMSD